MVVLKMQDETTWTLKRANLLISTLHYNLGACKTLIVIEKESAY